MEQDRSLRRLTSLEQSASTARVLNLLAAHRKHREDPSLDEAPFFRNKLLDNCLILKHRLRPHEYLHFGTPRPNVTKVLIPIDPTDLSAGAQTFFVGQKDYEVLLKSVFGDDLKPGTRDRQVLDLIDSLPSLDPFLLREHLRAHEIEPARPYFAISDADIQRMFAFVRQEVTALVELSAGAAGSAQHAAKLVDKLLSNAPDAGFEPLKLTLKLSDQEYLDGVFSWRGFIYYKWVLGDMGAPVTKVLTELTQITARGPVNPEAATYIPDAKRRLQINIAKTAASVQQMLDVYNNAYLALTRDSKPVAFREFLLSAPSMFASLGEQLGALQHIISFWRFRFPEGRRPLISYEELMDVLLEFEDSLVFAPRDQAQAWNV